MALPVVYEYFLTEDDYITGWQQWPINERPEFVGVQEPLPEMGTMNRDSNNRIYADGYIFKLINNTQIIKEEYIDTPPVDRITQLENNLIALEARVTVLESSK